MQFVILDTETTGLGQNDEVIELAIIEDKTKKVLFNKLFKPTQFSCNEAQEVHKISRSMLATAMPFTFYADEIRQILKDKIVIGWNVSFDKRLLSQTAKRYKLNCSFYLLLESYCAKNTFSDLFKMRLSLEQAAMHLNIATKQKHRAIDDCNLLADVVEKIAEKIENEK